MKSKEVVNIIVQYDFIILYIYIDYIIYMQYDLLSKLINK